MARAEKAGTAVLGRTLQKNLAGDKLGIPGWYTHFGSLEFANSAIPLIVRQVEHAYPLDRPITILGLGSGPALYERTVAKAFHDAGREVFLVPTDLQRESLAQIPSTDPFTVTGIYADATNIPLPDGSGDILILSRAVEHYLPPGGLEKMVAEAGRLLQPGELYAAQISSGDPLALGAFAAGLQAVAGKSETFLSVDDYKRAVATVITTDGETPLFKEVTSGYADAQPRTATDLARRYLNETFLSLNREQAGDAAGRYEEEITHVFAERTRLGREVQLGKNREEAINELDGIIQGTSAFQFFRDIFVGSIVDYWKGQGFEQGKGLMLIDKGQDVEISVQYPVIVWEKQPSKSI